MDYGGQGGARVRGKGADQVDPKTEKRRARERESARRSRRRKKEQLETLEKQAKDLARENESLRRELGIEQLDDPDSEYNDGIANIERMLASNAPGEELMQNVIALKQVFVKRFASLHTNLQEVQGVLLPIMQNEVSLWLLANMTLADEDEGSASAGDQLEGTGPLGASAQIGRKICKQLLASLALSKEQERRLQAFFSARRAQIRQLSGKHLEIIQLVRRLGEVQHTAAEENKALGHETDIIVSILTPQQRARLWLAVERYQPNIMQILRHECPPPETEPASLSSAASAEPSPPPRVGAQPAPASATATTRSRAQQAAAASAAAGPSAAGPSAEASRGSGGGGGGDSSSSEGALLQYVPGVLFGGPSGGLPMDSGVAAAAAAAANMLADPAPAQLAPLHLLSSGFGPLAPLPFLSGGSPFTSGFPPPSGGTTPTGFSLQLPPSMGPGPSSGNFLSPMATGWNLMSPAAIERAAAAGTLEPLHGP
eukprot:tig00000828_g4616.t1